MAYNDGENVDLMWWNRRFQMLISKGLEERNFEIHTKGF